VIALRERLDREHAKHAASMRTRLARLAADVATLPVADFGDCFTYALAEQAASRS
jgi:uncharacterized protein with PIN domain